MYINLLQKLLIYRILFKDILTFLGHDYRDASLKILYPVVKRTYVMIRQLRSLKKIIYLKTRMTTSINSEAQK